MELKIIPLPDRSVMVYKDDIQVTHAPNNLRTANRLWSMYGDAFVPYLHLFDLSESPVYSVWITNQEGTLRPFGLTNAHRPHTFGPGYIVVEGACAVPTDDQIAAEVVALKEEMARRELLRPSNLLGGMITDVMDEEITIEAPNGKTYTCYISEVSLES
jgi:hypothetical protein